MDAVVHAVTPGTTISASSRGDSSRSWRWLLCVLLLAATTVNYMDRQTLSATAKRIKAEFNLQNEQYGNLEMGFSLAFAAGSLLFGALADRVNLRLLYPAILLAWSGVGFATGLVESYSGLLLCRTLLGFFEAGHWPCSLTVVQRVFESRHRTMGNSILQGGSSIGAVLTPLIVQRSLESGANWRAPFLWIGGIGIAWVAIWLIAVRSRDLDTRQSGGPGSTLQDARSFPALLLTPRFLSLVVMVASINACWQLLRAWMPLFLQEGRGYSEAEANYFTSGYYIATELGVLSAGVGSLALGRLGVAVHAARCWVFLGCSCLTLMTAAAAVSPRGWALLGMLLLVGYGALGVFPCYYAFAQEISSRHQGKVNGILGVCAWVSTAILQKVFGRYIDQSRSYDLGLALVGLLPIASLVVLAALWNLGRRSSEAKESG